MAAKSRHRVPRASDIHTDSRLFLNRELSLLEFDRRVLAQATDPSTPLLEKLRFLTICSSNLDEFFEVRVAGLKEQAAYAVSHSGPDGLSPLEVLRAVSTKAHELIEEQYRVLQEEVLPALEGEGVRLRRRRTWTEAQQKWAYEFFLNQVLPVLTPVGLDPAHPFPEILNKSLNFIVTLEGRDAFGRSSGIAVVHVPRSLPRVIPFPKNAAECPHDFTLLSSIIHAHIGEIFPGMEVAECFQFRVTRNSELWVEEEEVDDLLQAIKGELGQRNYGAAVRLEVADNCPGETAQFLLSQFELGPLDFYCVNGPVNLNRLHTLYDLVERPDLKFPSFVPKVRLHTSGKSTIFQELRRGDHLLHHPFESIAPVMEIVRQAVVNPDVLAIKMTLYRTGIDSPLAETLIEAARAGKEVTVVIELRARFDEATNIDLATRLQEAGASVVYGVVGYKIHAKMMMVVVREEGRLRRYVHLGTGNYHTKTAQAYTDISLLTCKEEFGEDVHRLFQHLTGLGEVPVLRKLLHSPFTLKPTLLGLIAAEAREAKEGRPAKIMAKMNSLSDPDVIRALYAASQVGVEIRLIVRGICCLRPGVKDLSENITVRSIVGRFLEHCRIFYCYAGGEEKVYATSADWMLRNLESRVETCFPIEDQDLKARVIREGLEIYLEDNCLAWDLQPDGSYVRSGVANGTPPKPSQLRLLELCRQ